MKFSSKIFFIATIFFTVVGLKSKAQLNPFQAMYFDNQYIYNPAMAGAEQSTLRINTGYLQQWSSFQGTPRTALLTADWNPTGKVGIGININDDEAGLIHTTRVMGTYAYHLPINDAGDNLSFGINLGINDSKVDYNKVSGDLSDEQIAIYNQLKPYVDGDLGAAYTSGKLTVSAALPNLKSVFFQNSDQRFTADQLLFITMVSYKFDVSNDLNDWALEPLVGYRKVNGFKDIGDAGFNFQMKNYGLFFQGIYHTSQSMGFGVGIDQHTYLLSFSYNLETGPIANYTNGSFEFGLKIRLFNK